MRRETRVVEDSGRLDAFLAKSFPDMSRGYWQRRVAEGVVTVDGQARPADFRLKGGETVEVRWDSAPAPTLAPKVVHEDPHVLVLNKPSGLIVHPLGDSWLRTPRALEAEPDSLAGWLWRERPALRTLPRLGIVHRLDQGTSGVMVVAKTPAATESLLEQFRERGVEKRYRAIVAGKLAKKVTEVAVRVGRKGGERRVKAWAGGREALTEVHALKTSDAATLVEARPKTGRTHQIRVHLASLGHPVLGDREWPSKTEAPRLMLHAYRLSFTHPKTGKKVAYSAALPAEINAYWRDLTSASE